MSLFFLSGTRDIGLRAMVNSHPFKPCDGSDWQATINYSTPTAGAPMKPTDITIICPRIFPLFERTVSGSFGGAEVQLFMLAKSIVRSFPAQQIHILVADYGQDDRIMPLAGITLHRSFDFSKSFASRAKKFVLAFARAPHKVVIQRAVSPFTPFICLMTKLVGGRFIYMVACDAELNATHGFLKNPLVRVAFNWMLRFADIVVAQNSFQLSCLMSLGVRSVSVVRNGYELMDYKPNVNRTSVLWIGRNDWQKQPELFLQIVDDMPHISFMMICNPAMDRYSEQYYDLKDRACSMPNCRFLESVPFDEMVKIYSHARILVNTSVSEGFPNTFIQAAMSSVPIVSLNADPDNMIAYSEMGYCAKGDVELFKERLSELCLDNELVEIMGQRAFNYVSSNHDIEVQARLFMEMIYAECHAL